MTVKMINDKNRKMTENGRIIIKCCVKNCGRSVEKDKAVEIEGNFFCPQCGSILFREYFGLG